MAKSKSSAAKAGPAVAPCPPWIYVNDPANDGYAQKLTALIPKAVQIEIPAHGTISVRGFTAVLATEKCQSAVVVFSDSKSDDEEAEKLALVKTLRSLATVDAHNFVSINISHEKTTKAAIKRDWGTNHLHVEHEHVANMPVVAYKWLFNVLTIRETLFLLSEAKMREGTDSKLFPQFRYCTIRDSKTHPRDAKLQFVALVLTKPQIVAPNRITWSVADHTGCANFYFQHRGPSSQYTWDWVLSLKPGDRKALPRMPMVCITEKKHVTLLKSPFRVTSAIVGGTGSVIQKAGRGISKLGRIVKLGNRHEWVPEADVDVHGKKIVDHHSGGQFKYVPALEKSEIVVFTSDGKRSWSDKDSFATTEAGSAFDEKEKL